MKCKFEEKQYESLLNLELLENHKTIYVPGQVLEGTIGFDAALYSDNHEFWLLFKTQLAHTRSLKKGTNIRHKWWSELEKSINHFPDWNLNLFIQHKRPEFIKSKSGKEWSFWNKEYYRYDLTPHQQLALAQLEGNVASHALVVYASPAFYKLEDLWSIHQKGELVANSNFCTAGNLSGHGRYSYSSPGNKGKAHSEPEDVESVILDVWLSETQVSEETEQTSNTERIVQLGNAMNKSMVDTGDLQLMFTEVTRAVSGPDSSDFVASAARIWSFLFLTNTSWYVVSK